MPRLLIISSEFPPGPGGIGNHAFHLATQLERCGWDIRVLTPQAYMSDEEIERFNRLQSFSVVRTSSGNGWVRESVSRLRLLVKEIQGKDVDLLIATGRPAVLLASVAALLFGLKLVVIGHGKEFGINDFWDQRITRWAYQRADAVICVSHFTWRLMEKLGVKPRSGKVIHNGADDQRYYPLSNDKKLAFSQKTGLNKHPVLLTVGRVSDRKGQEIVIRSLPMILQEFPDAHYLIAGLPEIRQKLSDLAEELGVIANIHFLGHVNDDDLLGYLNCCDLFLMTSRNTQDGDCEGFGIAVVEAALCGKPSIVSKNSGLTEAIIDGETGIAVPEGDIDAVAQAVIKLLKDTALCQTMGMAAHTFALDQQTWKIKIAEYDLFFRKMLG